MLLTLAGLVGSAVRPTVELSGLGLVRHMTQMEQVYLAYAIHAGQAHMLRFAALGAMIRWI